MFIVEDEIEAYASLHTTPLPDLLEELKHETYSTMQAPQMLSGQLEGMLLQFLVGISGAKRVLEIGMFTGFSAQMMAAALPEDGELLTCDVNPRAETLAAKYFDRNPVGRKIKILMGPALKTLKSIEGPFDLVFIDADKTNYTNYYERAMELLSPNGLIAVDNVLWSGRVLDPRDESDHAIVDFNKHVQNDPRVSNVVLTIRDGLMLIRPVQPIV